MAWNTSRQTTRDRRDIAAKARQNAEDRRCPACKRKGALKVIYPSNEAVAHYGFALVSRRCRWCKYQDTQVIV
jgi:C4-type Zn-finger protein